MRFPRPKKCRHQQNYHRSSIFFFTDCQSKFWIWDNDTTADNNFEKTKRLTLKNPCEQIAIERVIICSYWSIMKSIRENIQTTVLKYGPNEVRFVRKTKVRIFSVWTELIGQSDLHCMAIIKDQNLLQIQNWKNLCLPWMQLLEVI